VGWPLRVTRHSMQMPMPQGGADSAGDGAAEGGLDAHDGGGDGGAGGTVRGWPLTVREIMRSGPGDRASGGMAGGSRGGGRGAGRRCRARW
jgi:hypothetical protein